MLGAAPLNVLIRSPTVRGAFAQLVASHIRVVNNEQYRQPMHVRTEALTDMQRDQLRRALLGSVAWVHGPVRWSADSAVLPDNQFRDPWAFKALVGRGWTSKV